MIRQFLLLYVVQNFGQFTREILFFTFFINKFSKKMYPSSVEIKYNWSWIRYPLKFKNLKFEQFEIWIWKILTPNLIFYFFKLYFTSKQILRSSYVRLCWATKFRLARGSHKNPLISHILFSFRLFLKEL